MNKLNFNKNIVYDSINLLNGFINSNKLYIEMTEEDKERLLANQNHLTICLNSDIRDHLSEEDLIAIQSCLNRLYDYKLNQ